MAGSGPLRDNVDFRRYWLGQVGSDLGTQMSIVAFPLLVLALGGSAAQAGGIATGSLVARTLFRLPAGVIVDRWDRRRLMIGSDLVRAFALGSIPLAALLGGGPTYPHLLLVAIVEGTAGSLFWPSAAASLRRLVPEHQLTAAIARSQARSRAASLIGPALGGWLFTVHRLVPFLADSFSYLISALLISRITTPLRPDPSNGSAPARDRRLSAGIRWFVGHRQLRTLVAFGGVLNLIAVSALLAVIVGAERRGLSGGTIGLLLACVGVGALCGALAGPAILRRLPVPQVFLALGAGWAVTAAVLMTGPPPWVIGAVLAAQYLMTAPSAIVTGKLLFLGAPEHLLGRVTTTADLLMSGLPALGPLLTGILLGAIGETRTWAVLGVLAVAATVVCMPIIRTLDSEKPEKEERHDVLRSAR